MASVGNFWFDPNVHFNVESLDNGWIMLSNSDVRLYAVGRTIEEAKADLAETLGTYRKTTSFATSLICMNRESN